MADEIDVMENFYDNGGEEEVTDETTEEVIADNAEDEVAEGDAEAETESEESQDNGEAEDSTPKEKAFKAKALDETTKRQAMESEMIALKAQVELLTKQGMVKGQTQEAAEDAPKEPDTLDDGYTSYMKGLINNATTETKINLSREFALDKYGDDYIEAEKFFMSNADQTLRAQALQSANPAKFVYDAVSKHKESVKVNDPDYRKTLEAEIRAQIAKEQSTNEEATPKEALKSKSILSKGEATPKGKAPEYVDEFDYYDKQSNY